MLATHSAHTPTPTQRKHSRPTAGALLRSRMACAPCHLTPAAAHSPAAAESPATPCSPSAPISPPQPPPHRWHPLCFSVPVAPAPALGRLPAHRIGTVCPPASPGLEPQSPDAQVSGACTQRPCGRPARRGVPATRPGDLARAARPAVFVNSLRAQPAGFPANNCAATPPPHRPEPASRTQCSHDRCGRSCETKETKSPQMTGH